MSELVDLILKLSQEIKVIHAYLQQFQKTRLERFKEVWIDGQDVMQTLHISKRTLQTLRDSGMLPHSIAESMANSITSSQILRVC